MQMLRRFPAHFLSRFDGGGKPPVDHFVEMGFDHGGEIGLHFVDFGEFG